MEIFLKRHIDEISRQPHVFPLPSSASTNYSESLSDPLPDKKVHDKEISCEIYRHKVLRGKKKQNGAIIVTSVQQSL